MTERAAPYYCPYCGDENLRMFGETHGHWRCGACQRVFRLGYVGTAADWTTDPERTPDIASGPAVTEST